jgi:hypothetical protein
LLSGGKHGDLHGIEMRLTGVSRNGRTPEEILHAHSVLVTILEYHIAQALRKIGDDHITVQLFVVVMLDAEVHLGNGEYGCVVESNLINVDTKTELKTEIF